MRRLQNVLVTGGAGFIGSNFIRSLLNNDNFSGQVFNLDVLTYAGNAESLTDIYDQHNGKRYRFIHGDIRDGDLISNIFNEYSIDTIVHFAAESHVDRSINGPREFIETNIIGTFTLLEVAREAWGDNDSYLFHHVSTDEVFGSLGTEGYFSESTPYDPKSPYSAAKASSDHLVRAYSHTYDLPVTISNCSNNYGPFQFPEKLVPVMILNILEGKPLPVYGDGKNIRDWLYVDDHNQAIWQIIAKGTSGATYTLGGENEWENIHLVNVLCEKIASVQSKGPEFYKDLISFVNDRPGHDRRYAVDCSKIKSELGWSQTVDFSAGLDRTIDWYMNNGNWIERVRSGEYKKWIELNYEKR